MLRIRQLDVRVNISRPGSLAKLQLKRVQSVFFYVDIACLWH